MNVTMSAFCLRQFEADFAGTRFTDVTSDFLTLIVEKAFDEKKLVDGYAPFCKHLYIENPTNAKLGVLEITDENRSNLRSAYRARKEGELPVLTRWFEGLDAPRAPMLDVILYSREQYAKEGKHIDTAWAIVCILGVIDERGEPMSPITILRNALGVEEGGSGVPLDREAYQRSVEFWDSHANVV